MIKADPRVFGKDVMSYDQFSQPFDQWIRQTTDQYLKPDFLRYQYDPFVKQANQQMWDMNQNQGLSGAWRARQSGTDLSNAAQGFNLQGEDLRRQYNDQALQVRDKFLNAWANPLYQSQMQKFYEAPFRNMNLGDIQAKTTPDTNQFPQLGGFGQIGMGMNPNTNTQPYNSWGNNTEYYKQYLGGLGNNLPLPTPTPAPRSGPMPPVSNPYMAKWGIRSGTGDRGNQVSWNV